MYRLALIVFAALGLLASPALAKDAQSSVWFVSQLSGDARVVRGGLHPAALTVNAKLAPGDIVFTGNTGRATLSRGADYVLIAPRSELRLPVAEQPNGFTRVIQNLGTMLFKVRHTGIPHFTVDTPMLAAVVKGTTFTVVVDKDRSAVQVIEGVVEVSAIDGGMKKLVEGGRTVFINRDNPKTLLNADTGAPAPTAPKSDSAVAIVGPADESVQTIASLTSGLVRAEIAPSATLVIAKPVVNSPVSAAPADSSPTSGTVSTPVAIDPTATTPTAGTPTISTPNVSTPAVTTPTINTPAVTTPAITTPTITTPIATVPTLTVPTVTVPIVTVPAVTIPAVTVPTISTPTITTPTITTPVATVPTVTVPTLTVPTVTVPTVTVPTLTVPTVTVPIVTVPTVTVPTVTIPVPHLGL